jgi:hypothetical protein
MYNSADMGSGGMMYEYIPNFIKTLSDIQKLMEGGIHRHKDTQTARRWLSA